MAWVRFNRNSKFGFETKRPLHFDVARFLVLSPQVFPMDKVDVLSKLAERFARQDICSVILEVRGVCLREKFESSLKNWREGLLPHRNECTRQAGQVHRCPSCRRRRACRPRSCRARRLGSANKEARTRKRCPTRRPPTDDGARCLLRRHAADVR